LLNPQVLIRRAALNLLARREYSVQEMTDKLSRKNFALYDIQAVLTSLIQENLLSNSRFLQNYIAYRQRRGIGPLRIKKELQERGLDKSFIEECLKEEAEEWFATIQAVWRKRFKNILPEDYKSKAQQMRFLQYRGFTAAQIESIFSS